MCKIRPSAPSAPPPLLPATAAPSPSLALCLLALCLLVGAAPLAGQEEAAQEREAAQEPSRQATPRVVRVSPDAELDAPREPGRTSTRLQRIADSVPPPYRLELRPGHYYLEPVSLREERCGNCEDPATPVTATRGLLLTGPGVEIVGPSPDSVIIHTNAGYGILFQDCAGCALRGVTVTGGVRDPDGNATNAAVVVKRSSVVVSDCHIHDNVGDPAVVTRTVAGVMGITGREGSSIWVEGCRIERNSWDGIALYRDARAVIRDNVIDGVDAASGATVGGGRGVGIGLTWNAEAVVEGNLVRRYWKGIGIFVDARASVRENVVEDVLTWGIAYWDAGRGHPTAFVEGNAVFRTGACGGSITRESRDGRPPGAFVGNAFVRTGQNPQYDSGEPYCEQTALARHAVPPGLLLRGNLFYQNREPGGMAGRHDIDARMFRRLAPALLDRLSLRPALEESEFLREHRTR